MKRFAEYDSYDRYSPKCIVLMQLEQMLRMISDVFSKVDVCSAQKLQRVAFGENLANETSTSREGRNEVAQAAENHGKNT